MIMSARQMETILLMLPFAIGCIYGLIVERRKSAPRMSGRAMLVASIVAIIAVFVFLILADLVWGAHHLSRYDQMLVQSVARALMYLPVFAVPAAPLAIAGCVISQYLSHKIALRRRR